MLCASRVRRVLSCGDEGSAERSVSIFYAELFLRVALEPTIWPVFVAGSNGSQLGFLGIRVARSLLRVFRFGVGIWGARSSPAASASSA